MIQFTNLFSHVVVLFYPTSSVMQTSYTSIITDSCNLSTTTMTTQGCHTKTETVDAKGQAVHVVWTAACV